jgi:hypothetical protein
MIVSPEDYGMWYNRPLINGFSPLLPQNLLNVLIRVFALVQVGGVRGVGTERGRRFEQTFYNICKRQNFLLSETSGAKTLAGQNSGSGFSHEVDAASLSVAGITHWELKYLSTPVKKNELLIFNSKCLDYIYGCSSHYAKLPIRRFLLSGSRVSNECRRFAAEWGILVIEPGNLPLPLIYEALARGNLDGLGLEERVAVQRISPWTCRPIQDVVRELSGWCNNEDHGTTIHPVIRRANEAIHLQDKIGNDVIDEIEEQNPDWLDDLVDKLWYETGGW